MNIVLNENEWIENLIDNDTVPDNMFVKADILRMIARYYLDKGYSKNDVYKKIEFIMLKHGQFKKRFVRMTKINCAINDALKQNAVCIEQITIYKNEIERINELKSKPARRIAFTFLCLAKYYNEVKQNNDCWVGVQYNEVMKMANVNTSTKRICDIISTMASAGMLQVSNKVNDTSVKVLFIGSGDIALELSDFRDLGNQYLKYCGEPYFTCVNCGLTVKYNDPRNYRNQKYCKKCAAEISLKNRIESVMRGRVSKEYK